LQLRSHVPLCPISCCITQALKVQSKGQMKDMLDGLVRAAAAKMSSETGLNGQPLRLTGA
jgi:hypothetical protein